jgi:hypothetical protein
LLADVLMNLLIRPDSQNQWPFWQCRRQALRAR